MGMNLEKNISRMNEIKENVKEKKKELTELENNKRELLDMVTDIQGSDTDDDSKRKVIDLANASLDDNAKKGIELSGEMNKDVESIEEIKQETSVSLESNLSVQEKIARKKEILDKFGLGGKLGEGLTELVDNENKLKQFENDSLAVEKDLTETATKLEML